MDILREKYDFIILDGPPVDTVTDGQIVAARADGVALVTPQGIATKDAVMQAVKLLQRVNANILGVIMNRFTAQEAGGYYGGYYGNYYGGSYYGTDDSSSRKGSKKRGKK